MLKLLNKENRPISVNLLNGKTVGLLARGTAVIDDEDITSSHLQGFIERGEIVAIPSDTNNAQAAGSTKKSEDVRTQSEKTSDKKKTSLHSNLKNVIE